MDILEAQDGPGTVAHKGQLYTLPLWSTRNLLPVLSKLKTKRIDMCRKHLIAEGVDALHRARALFEEESRETHPWDAHVYFSGAEGTDECLVESLKRGGTAESLAWEIVDAMRFEDKQTLAVKVAHIYRPAPIKASPADTQGTQPQGLGLGEGKAPEQPKGLGEGGPVPTVPAPAGN